MIDIDDTLALNTLKTLKADDQGGDLILQSGDRIEDEARELPLLDQIRFSRPPQPPQTSRAKP